MLVVIAIIGVLVALLLPAVQAARESARRAKCASNLRQLGLAILNYEASFKTLPTSAAYDHPDADPVQPTSPIPGQTGKGWILSILPQLEQTALFKTFADNDGFKGQMGSGTSTGLARAAGGIQRPACLPAMATKLSILACPSDPSARISTQQYQWTGIPVAVTSYNGVLGDTRMGTTSVHQGTLPDCHRTRKCNGLFWRHSYLGRLPLASITDGQSNTFMVGEDIPDENTHSAAFYANGDYCSCHAPLNYFPKPATPSIWPNVMSFRSRHFGGAQFCLADGSVRFVAENVDYATYRAACTKAGGEAINIP
jgi:type II secretory pathway pseudopilin PulG